MAEVTVKILKNNMEVHSERFVSPVTAADAKAALTDINGDWRGRLLEPGSDIILAGGYELTPGLTYHLHLRQQAGQNLSTRTVSRLVSDGPALLPTSKELADLLQKPPPVQAPITVGAGRMLQHLSDPASADRFVIDQRGGSLARAVGTAVCAPAHVEGQVTSSYVDAVLIGPLLALDKAQPLHQRLDLELQRKTPQSPSEMTQLKGASGDSLQPDLMLREASTGRLLFRGEERGTEDQMLEAAADLTKKMARWSEYYYGDLEYLLSYAAAGRFLQFFALQRGSPVSAVEISPLYDLSSPDGCAALVLATFNLYTLLAAVQRSLSRYVLPAGKELSIQHPEGFTRTLYAPPYMQYFCPDQPRVLKVIAPWLTYSEAFEVGQQCLKKVYARTAHRAGLVHAVRGPVVGTAYEVELEPVGIRGKDAIVRFEAELLHAAHGLLHGLDALHSEGFVHRDMRWDNTACDVNKRHYFLLDLELAAPADLDPGFHLTTWTPDTLVEGQYKTSSDLHMLGQMLRERMRRMATTSAAKQFVTAIARSAEQLSQERVTAASLLRHDWIRCAGRHCRQAGAQPCTGGPSTT